MAKTTIHSDYIPDNAITSTKIAENSIGAREIATNAITTLYVADGSVSSEKLASNIDIAGTFDVTGATTLDAGLTVDTDTLVVDATNNRVGIGTSSPSHDLTIQKSGQDNYIRIGSNTDGYDAGVYFGTNADWSIGIDNSNSNAFTIGSGSTVGTNPRVTIDSSGNVGIGVSSISTQGQLYIGASGVSTDVKIGLSPTNSSGGQNPLAQIGSTADGTYGSELYFTTRSTGGTVSEAMRIDSSGKVGIGTTSPAQKLHIDGFALFENNDEIRFKDTGGTQRTAIAMFSNDLNIGTSAGGNLKFYNGSTYVERMRIDSTGNVAIGDTSSRSFRLYLENAGSSGAGQLMLVDSDNSGLQREIRTDAGVLSFDYWDGSNRSNHLTIASNGNVGIGTDSPSSYQANADDLVVATAGHTGITIASGTSHLGNIHFADGTSGDDAYRGFIQYEHTANYMRFATNASEAMRIDSSGNVGIGLTAQSTNKLEVFGNIQVNASYGKGFLLLDNNKITRENGGMAFSTANTERMRIDSSGNVLIGATSTNTGSFGSISPQLQVAGSMPQVLLHETDTDKDGYIGIAGSTMYIQTADAIPIRFGTSDAERMRIDASGNVGIGTDSPTGKLEISATGTNASPHIKLTESGDTREFNIYNDGSGNGRLVLADTDDTPDTEIVLADNGVIQFKTANTERMLVDNRGNISFGSQKVDPVWSQFFNAISSNYGGHLHFQNNGYPVTVLGNNYYINNSTQNERVTANPTQAFKLDNLGNFLFESAASGTAGATFSFSERMRIDSSGNLLVGTTSANFSLSSQVMDGFGVSGSNKFVTIGVDSDYCLALQRNGSDGVIQYFFNGTTFCGNISISGSSTAYNTSSDYRLKENVDYEFNALDRVAQLKPARFNFIADADTTVDGFLAHEVQDIVPEAITGEKDAVDSEGNPEYQGIDQSKLVPLLTKAIQEQQELINNLTARIEQLEN